MIQVGGKTVLTTITEIADPSHAALLVIDMQNDCCAKGGAFHERGADLTLYERMIPQLEAVIGSARSAGVLIIFIQATTLPALRSQSGPQLLFEQRLRDNYNMKDEGPFEFCRPGTWGHAFLDEIAPQEGDLVVQKHRSSAFIGTNLDLILRSNSIKSIVATGCTTEGCVDSTIRDAGFLDYYPVAVRDCIASDDPGLHEAALTILSAYRALVTDSEELVEIWSPAPMKTASDQTREDVRA